jgi:hypothetical protein
MVSGGLPVEGPCHHGSHFQSLERFTGCCQVLLASKTIYPNASCASRRHQGRHWTTATPNTTTVTLHHRVPQTRRDGLPATAVQGVAAKQELAAAEGKLAAAEGKLVVAEGKLVVAEGKLAAAKQEYTPWRARQTWPWSTIRYHRWSRTQNWGHLDCPGGRPSGPAHCHRLHPSGP